VRYVLPSRPPCIRSFTIELLERCLSTPNKTNTTAHETLRPQLATPLLKEWAKLRLIGGPWEVALAVAVTVSILLLWYPFAGLTLRWCAVYGFEIHNLSDYL